MAVQCRQPFAVQLQMDLAVRCIAAACGMTQKGERCRPPFFAIDPHQKRISAPKLSTSARLIVRSS
ncbi:hypothetical protein NY98_07670 [Xanthomonas citri pv. fuscans]|uniref:Secreted protein n=1 Tax=Xanthomonas citri pv. fuscans TaxID=366649 RepID=A0AB34QAW9_XANCI|nr:hypothetical protein TP37_20675 [Xanthomonas citri pv. aurantifolii]AZU19247.1 hypothetical protein AC613_19995 [Xanthomonas citri pv. fuscans]KGP25727.1 hypothetical protein NY65_15005 [Xanthomonas phaseoli pv. phaseoli]QOY23387.1 hypothetical protein FYK61_19675 [Xanthomonas citri]AMV04543.1 hypothetical protein TP50_20480 [Xanthomonas citri pv. aurantifolii]